MERLGHWWKAVPRPVRQSLVLLVGTLVVLVGVVMLPLPGPGWVIIFFGFAILATEFQFAAQIRDRLINAVKSAIEWCKKWWRSLFKSSKHKR